MTQQEVGEDVVAGKGGVGSTGNITVVAQWVEGSCIIVPELLSVKGGGSDAQRTPQAQDGPSWV